MKSKKESSSKVLDISRPKKRTAAATVPSAPQLVIPRRSVIVPVSDGATEDTTPDPAPAAARRIALSIEPQTAPPLPTPQPQPTAATPEPAAVPEQPAPKESAPRRLEIAVVPKPSATPEAPEQPAQDKPVQQPPAAPQPQPRLQLASEPRSQLAAQPQPKPAPSAPATTSTPAKAKDAPVPAAPSEAPAPDAPEDAEDATANPASSKSAKADANVHKALEDAKREQEIQGYIDNREFFVPINAVARKRSVKVSAGLIFVEILLGLFLLNLMLDAELIYLLEKIPHTNFFDL